MRLLITFIIVLLAVFKANGQEVFTYFSPPENNPSKITSHYDKEVLELALRLTEKEYGPYQLVGTPVGLSINRVFKLTQQKKITNYFLKYSARDTLAELYEPIYFPVDLGVVGYRVAITSQQLVQADLQHINTLEQLATFSNIQGKEWLDAKILKKNHVPVVTVEDSLKIFELLVAGRAGLFFRGINEWKYELDTFFKGQLKLEQKLALHYPLPRFFYTEKGNERNAKRVKEGLLMAYQNGMLLALWKKYYQQSVKETQLSKRKLIELENPFIANVPTEYQQYNLTLADLTRIEKE